MQLGKNSRAVRVSNATAAGVTTVNSTVLDMAGFNSVLFLVAMGAIVAGAVTSVKLQHGELADGSDMADIAGSSQAVAVASANKLVTVELLQPTKRYVRVVVLRATSNSTIDGITAIQHESKRYPPALDTTVASYAAVLGPQSGAA